MPWILPAGICVLLAVFVVNCGGIDFTAESVTVLTLHTSPVSWEVARSSCESTGTVLLDMSDPYKRTILEDLYDEPSWAEHLSAENFTIWIGLYDEDPPNQVFVWANSSEIETWSTSVTTTSTVRCVLAAEKNVLWEAAHCNHNHMYVCESKIETPCNYTVTTRRALGIVDKSLYYNDPGGTTTDEYCKNNCLPNPRCWSTYLSKIFSGCLDAIVDTPEDVKTIFSPTTDIYRKDCILDGVETASYTTSTMLQTTTEIETTTVATTSTTEITSTEIESATEGIFTTTETATTETSTEIESTTEGTSTTTKTTSTEIEFTTEGISTTTETTTIDTSTELASSTESTATTTEMASTETSTETEYTTEGSSTTTEVVSTKSGLSTTETTPTLPGPSTSIGDIATTSTEIARATTEILTTTTEKLPTTPTVPYTSSAYKTTSTQILTSSNGEDTTSASDISSTKTPTTGVECICPCNNRPLSNLTYWEKEAIVETILKNLTLNKSALSSTRRRFISVRDDRPSAVAVGASGASLLCLVLGIFILFDLDRLVHFCGSAKIWLKMK